MTIAAKYKPNPTTDNTKPSINCIYYPSIYNTNTTIRLKQLNDGTKLTINIAILYLKHSHLKVISGTMDYSGKNMDIKTVHFSPMCAWLQSKITSCVIHEFMNIYFVLVFLAPNDG